MDSRRDGGGPSVFRRDLLRSIGAAGLAGLAGCGGSEGVTDGDGTPTPTPVGNFPVSGDSVTFGFNVASSGAYSTAGKQELRGFKLAVKHINNGGGWVTSEKYGSPLDGDGLLDKDVEFAVEDTGGNSDTARSNAQRLVDSEEVIMLAGGTSSSSGLANQEVAAQNQVVYMATMANANSLTGADCNRYSFREMFNNRMAAEALAPASVTSSEMTSITSRSPRTMSGGGRSGTIWIQPRESRLGTHLGHDCTGRDDRLLSVRRRP